MSYSLNGILLSDYGIIPGRVPGSNVAMSGQFDLPSRIGTTYQKWDDGGEIEPFVDADEIFLGGRDLVFHGYIEGIKSSIAIKADRFRQVVAEFPDLVTFHSDDFGDFSVKVKSIDTDLKEGIGELKITMREPVADLSGGVLPPIVYSPYTVDSMSLESFGMYISSVSGRGFTAADSQEYFTVYGKEAVQVNGLTPNEIKIEGHLEGANLSDFKSNIKALWRLFTDPGLRSVRLNNYVTISGFVTNGFKVSGLIISNNTIIATIAMTLINVRETLTVFKHADVGGKILMTEEGKILVL